MSVIDKIKSLFSGGSSPDAHAGHDHSGHDHDHAHEPAMPADPAGMPMSEPAAEDGEDRPA